MKALLIALSLAAGTAGIYVARDCGPCCADAVAVSAAASAERPAVTSQVIVLTNRPPAPTAVRADFVEARSASVFAGACHVNSEVASQGRQALMAWSIREGTAVDADLAGVRVVAAVSGDRNLAEGGPRSSVVWIDAPGGERQLAAAKAWLSAEQGAALGDVRRVEPHAISFERDGTHFAVAVGDAVALRGEAIADGSCCSMQEHRWYEPLGAAAGQPVGVPDECFFGGADGLPAWRYEGANNTFVGEYVGADPAPRRSSSGGATAATADCGRAPVAGACATKRAKACGSSTSASTIDA